MKTRSKSFVLLSGVVLSFGVLLYISYVSMVHAPNPDLRTLTAKINGHKFNLEVAENPQTRAKGLGGRLGLNEGEGMLFIFDNPDIECFWMKNVSFPIDILWFDDSKKLVHKIENLSPTTYPDSFCPTQPAQFVVELPAGSLSKYQFDLGSVLDF